MTERSMSFERKCPVTGREERVLTSEWDKDRDVLLLYAIPSTWDPTARKFYVTKDELRDICYEMGIL